jgi:hypothetical protein
MTTIAVSPNTLDTSTPQAPESLVGLALECVPEPCIPAGQSITDGDRCAAVHDVVTAIRNGLLYFTEDDRRQLAAVLLTTVASVRS